MKIRCGFLFSKSGMLFVIIGLWFFCGLLIRFYNFGLEKFKCQTYRSHVRPCGLRGLCGLRGMLLSHTLTTYFKKNTQKHKPIEIIWVGLYYFIVHVYLPM